MWKQTEKESPANQPKPTQSPVQSISAATPAPAVPGANAGAAVRGSDKPTYVGKSISFKGTVNGSEDLYIDGKLEGSIDLGKNLVTVGLNGNVQADVSAREVVILGKLSGNVTATDRVEIRQQGALTGDVTAARISIEDGAFFKGGIDIQKSGSSRAANG